MVFVTLPDRLFFRVVETRGYSELRKQSLIGSTFMIDDDHRAANSPNCIIYDQKKFIVIKNRAEMKQKFHVFYGFTRIDNLCSWIGIPLMHADGTIIGMVTIDECHGNGELTEVIAQKIFDRIYPFDIFISNTNLSNLKMSGGVDTLSPEPRIEVIVTLRAGVDPKLIDLPLEYGVGRRYFASVTESEMIKLKISNLVESVSAVDVSFSTSGHIFIKRKPSNGFSTSSRGTNANETKIGDNWYCVELSDDETYERTPDDELVTAISPVFGNGALSASSTGDADLAKRVHDLVTDAPIDGGEGVRVCIIDTGLCTSYIPENLYFTDFAENTANGHFDSSGHGTHIYGIFHQLAPNATYYIAKVSDSNHNISYKSIVRGIQWARDQDAHLVNISLQPQNRLTEDLKDMMVECIEELVRIRPQCKIFVSAGNYLECLWPIELQRLVNIVHCGLTKFSYPSYPPKSSQSYYGHILSYKACSDMLDSNIFPHKSVDSESELVSAVGSSQATAIASCNQIYVIQQSKHCK
jgi:hypothetical protein